MTEKNENGKYFYLLEMEDSIEGAIENAEKVKEQHLELIELIKDSNKAEKFEKFTESLENQVDEINSQIKTLNTRLEALRFVNSYEDKEIIEKLITTLGLFE